MPRLSDRVGTFTDSVIRRMTRINNQYDSINRYSNATDQFWRYIRYDHNGGDRAGIKCVPSDQTKIEKEVAGCYEMVS